MVSSFTPKQGKTKDKRHWDSIYRSKQEQQVSWYQSELRVSLDLIKHAGLAREDPIIDAGGGASRLVDSLLELGYSDLSVLDISSEAMQKCRQRLQKQADRIQWMEVDVCKFTPTKTYALWHDRALFHFMTEATGRRDYLDAMRHALKPGGQAIIATFAVGGPRKCSGLDTLQCDADFLLNELGGEFSLVEERQETHLTPAGQEQSFTYFRFKHGRQQQA